VTKAAIEHISDMLGMPKIRVLEVATFYTQFQLKPVGTRAHVQVCGTTPCMLRGSEDLIRVCKEKIHPEPFHTNAEGTLSWEEVECLGACVNAPMVMIFKDTYEDLTPQRLEEIIHAFETGKGDTVPPGPQNGRWFAEAATGRTTLKDGKAASKKGAAKPAPAKPAAEKPATAPKKVAAEPAKAVASAKPAAAPKVSAPVKAPEAAKPAEPAKPAAQVRPAKPSALKSAAELMSKPADAKAKPAKTATPKSAPEATAKAATEKQPELLKKPRTGKGDDLKLIWGVGPKLAKMLNEMGVWHFDQVASWGKAELAWVDERLEGFKGRASRDEWVKQAKKLATGWRPSSAVGDKPE
jgi:NADH-quinone oxidoreductase subunit E